MKYFQILSCNNALGTCCSDYGLVTLLDIMRQVFDLIQLVVPILLLIMMTVQLIKLIANPDEKKGMKKIVNQLIGAVICFFLPTMINVVMSWMPEDQSFQVAGCWEMAKTYKEYSQSQKSVYIKINDKKTTSILIDPGDYDEATATAKSSEKGKAIVEYAKKFVGKNYVYGGTWNGEEPYQGTDCSGFVQGVFKHFGIELKRTTDAQWADTSSYELVSPGNIKAGDIVNYGGSGTGGHTGILTGNGTEIVHAKSTKYGIVLDPDYRTCSSKKINGIMRIKGVN